MFVHVVLLTRFTPLCTHISPLLPHLTHSRAGFKLAGNFLQVQISFLLSNFPSLPLTPHPFLSLNSLSSHSSPFIHSPPPHPLPSISLSSLPHHSPPFPITPSLLSHSLSSSSFPSPRSPPLTPLPSLPSPRSPPRAPLPSIIPLPSLPNLSTHSSSLIHSPPSHSSLIHSPPSLIHSPSLSFLSHPSLWLPPSDFLPLTPFPHSFHHPFPLTPPLFSLPSPYLPIQSLFSLSFSPSRPSSLSSHSFPFIQIHSPLLTPLPSLSLSFLPSHYLCTFSPVRWLKAWRLNKPRDDEPHTPVVWVM